jgi:hypothetical protein
MACIFGFLCVHVALAVLVPKTIVAMVTGGPSLEPQEDPPAQPPTPVEAAA